MIRISIALLLVWFCVLFLKLKQEIQSQISPVFHFETLGLTSRPKLAVYAKLKRPSCILFLPLPVKNPSHQISPAWVAFSTLTFTSLIPICHIECFRRSACTSQPLLRLGRYTPVQRFLGMCLGAQTRLLRRGSADVVVYAYV